MCIPADVLDPQDVYAFIALATFYNKFYGQCSKAFVKLEALPALRPDQRDAYAALAVSIFLQASTALRENKHRLPAAVRQVSG